MSLMQSMTKFHLLSICLVATLSGPEAFLWSQISGPVVALKPTSGHEGVLPIDSMQFTAPNNRPNSTLSFSNGYRNFRRY